MKHAATWRRGQLRPGYYDVNASNDTGALEWQWRESWTASKAMVQPQQEHPQPERNHSAKKAACLYSPLLGCVPYQGR
jgi:hypothetical protein